MLKIPAIEHALRDRELTSKERLALRAEIDAARKRIVPANVAMESLVQIEARLGDRLWEGRPALADELRDRCTVMRSETDAQAETIYTAGAEEDRRAFHNHASVHARVAEILRLRDSLIPHWIRSGEVTTDELEKRFKRAVAELPPVDDPMVLAREAGHDPGPPAAA